MLLTGSASPAASSVTSSGRMATRTRSPGDAGAPTSTWRPLTSITATFISTASTRPSTIVSTPTKRATSSEAGAQKTRDVSSNWRMRPSSSTATRSASACASARSWVTITGRHPLGAQDFPELGDQRRACGRVQCRERFVEQQHGRIEDERPRQRDALGFAAGEAARATITQLANAEAREPPIDTRGDVRCSEAAEPQPGRDVTGDPTPGEHRLLEDRGYTPALVERARRLHDASFKADRPGGGCLEYLEQHP